MGEAEEAEVEEGSVGAAEAAVWVAGVGAFPEAVRQEADRSAVDIADPAVVGIIHEVVQPGAVL